MSPVSRAAVVSCARTPIGRYAGQFAKVEGFQLGALALRGAIDRTVGLQGLPVDEVVMGCIGQVGPEAYNARRVALAAGLPVSTPAYNVNRLCGSGLQAILGAAQQVQTGQSRIVVAGGNESMSSIPFLLPEARLGSKPGDRTLVDGTLAILTDPWSGSLMGGTAENVAKRFGVSRQEQDEWSLLSQQRAGAAISSGDLDAELVPVEVPGRAGTSNTVTTDEHPRPDVTADGLAALRPAFAEDGSVTAGNSSGMNDGAAATIVMDEVDARALGAEPMIRLLGWASGALEPEIMGYAPTIAVQRVLQQLNLTIRDIDVIELNEAFAAQVIAVMRATDMTHDQVNPYGGAIAFGHPVGATGAILTTRIAHFMSSRERELGMVTMCIGGGQALAAVFENCNVDRSRA